jgi:heterodisulfide reductase subunit C
MQQAGQGVYAGKVAPPAGELASVINQCYQCCKCSAGCPVASEMDLMPHQLVRLAVLGNVDRIVESKSIWLCLTCHTCGARCPNGIDVPALLDPIRHQVLRNKIKTKESQVGIFHEAFMKNIRMFGRVHELSLIGVYKMKTKTYFNDMELGMQMFKKGKIHLLPHKSSHLSEVKDVFKRSSMK